MFLMSANLLTVFATDYRHCRRPILQILIPSCICEKVPSGGNSNVHVCDLRVKGGKNMDTPCMRSQNLKLWMIAVGDKSLHLDNILTKNT